MAALALHQRHRGETLANQLLDRLVRDRCTIMLAVLRRPLRRVAKLVVGRVGPNRRNTVVAAALRAAARDADNERQRQKKVGLHSRASGTVGKVEHRPEKPRGGTG